MKVSALSWFDSHLEDSVVLIYSFVVAYFYELDIFLATLLHILWSL